MRTVGPRVLVIWSLVGLLLVGCSGAPDDAPEVAPVKGKVTRKGAALAGVMVSYQPIDVPEGAARSGSTGVTNEQGEYELIYNRNLNGAVPGKHQVTLIKDDGLDDEDERKKAPNEIVIPKDKASHEVTVPPEGLDGGAANFDLDF